VTNSGALLEALGILLAAYLFLLERTQASQDAAAQLHRRTVDDVNSLGATARDAVISAANLRDSTILLAGLAVAPALVALVFLPVGVEIVRGVDPSSDYDAVKAAVLLLEAIWIGLAVWLGRRAVRLARLAMWARGEATYRVRVQEEHFAVIREELRRDVEGAAD
jgi:hypothetical protein